MSGSTPTESWRGYTVRHETWRIAGDAFELTWPADVDGLLDLPRTVERFAKDEYLPYWAQPWPAAAMLAEAVLAGEPGRGRSAIDMGCGIGLVSLAAARRGYRVTAADYDEDALAFALGNAERNRITLAAAERIDYRQPWDGPRFACILGADLLYEQRNAEPLVRWIDAALEPDGQAWLSDPDRTAAQAFPDLAAAAGFDVRVEPVETTVPDGQVHRGRIWRLTRRTG